MQQQKPATPQKPSEQVVIDVEIVRSNKPVSAARLKAGEDFMTALMTRLSKNKLAS